MTTSSFPYRPATFIAAAAAVAALAVGSVAVSLPWGTDHPSAPGQPAKSSTHQSTTNAHHFEYTTSGGRIMVGE
jgi:hypothetical protein